MKKPDWRNPEDYLYLKDLKLNQWAFEFLRRNPEYIKDWNKLNKKYSQIPEHAMVPRDVVKLECELSFKWGIVELRDPERPYNDTDGHEHGIGFYPPGGFETVLMGKTDEQLDCLYAGLPNFKTGEQNFCFNFHLPIEPQLKTAKKMLLKLQKTSGGRRVFKPRKDNRIEEWTNLLRIADAKTAGASSTEIVDVLSSEPGKAGFNLQAIYDKHKQAKKFIESDYRLIPFHNNYEE